VLFLEAIHPGLDEYFDGLRRDIPDCDILPTPFEKDELLAIVHRRVTGWSIAERRTTEKLGVDAAMKLRYTEIDPEIIAELPNWSTTELERESEETLKELGITRQANESHLLAWVGTMLVENGCENNCENRKRLIEAIREDWNAQLFVWALGGDERKAFGLEDSPAFQEHLARHYANRALAPGAFYDHDDPRYWDYQPQSGQSSGARQSVRSGQVAQAVLGLLVVAAGVWAAHGLEPVGWSLVDFLVLLVWMGLTAAGAGLLLGLAVLAAGESGGASLQRLALLVAVPVALTAIGLHLDASRKVEADAAQRERWVVPPIVDEESVEEVGYINQMRREDHLWDHLWKHRREIYWFVKIPATNKLYSCSWESGFAGFAKDDAVKLIHKKPGTETGDYYGFIVGLHGRQAGRSATVWALDTDEIEVLIDDIGE
jgi:hypothetical protein